jgi:uncharacterized protein (DUF1501 family)
MEQRIVRQRPDRPGSHLDRREVLRFGLYGFAGLSLPGLLRARQVQAAGSGPRTAIILVWLRGGASHLDTLDPKPLASSEFRGPFQPIQTSAPGMLVTELLPRLAQTADRFTLLRSMAHTGGGHPAGSLQVLSGDPDPQDKPGPRYPDWMSIAHKVRADRPRVLPNYVAVNPVDRYDSFVIAGSTYLGPSAEPFKVLGDPSHPRFEVPNVGLADSSHEQQLRRRAELRSALDRLRFDIDQSGMMASVDQFAAQAVNMLLSPQARDAFDLGREPDAVRDRYGRHQWGQQCLLARRLVEAGVEIITTEFDGPLCGRVANWDDHAVNHNVFEAIKYRAPFFDQAVSALIEDIYDRGLDRRVLVVVTGEFGRTPRISYVASSGGGVASAPAGTVQPGRDHWPQANTMLFAGGGIRTGQVIGATNPRGEEPIHRRVGTADFLATLYRHLGIDASFAAFNDFSGRPIPILHQGGSAIPELCSTA